VRSSPWHSHQTASWSRLRLTTAQSRLWDATTGAARGMLDASEAIGNLSFSNDGSYVETDRGLLMLGSLSPSTIPPQSNTSCKVHVKDHWVAREMENVLWLALITERHVRLSGTMLLPEDMRLAEFC
jgi:hypothetical protein